MVATWLRDNRTNKWRLLPLLRTTGLPPLLPWWLLPKSTLPGSNWLKRSAQRSMTCTNTACAAAVTMALTTVPTSCVTSAVSCAMHAASTTLEATDTEDPKTRRHENPKTMTCDELTCYQKKNKTKNMVYGSVCFFSCLWHVTNKIEMLFYILPDCMDTQTSDKHDSYFRWTLCSQTSWTFSFRLDSGISRYHHSWNLPVSSSRSATSSSQDRASSSFAHSWACEECCVCFPRLFQLFRRSFRENLCSLDSYPISRCYSFETSRMFRNGIVGRQYIRHLWIFTCWWRHLWTHLLCIHSGNLSNSRFPFRLSLACPSCHSPPLCSALLGQLLLLRLWTYRQDRPEFVSQVWVSRWSRWGNLCLLFVCWTNRRRRLRGVHPPQRRCWGK